MDLLADSLHFGTSVFFVHVGLEQCEVWGVKSAVWSVKCEGSSGKWEVWSVECEVWSVKFKFGVRRAQCEVWGLECEGSSEKWEVWSVKCEVWSVKFEVWSAKSAVCSVRCGVSREGHGRDRLSLNYRSFIFGKLPPPVCPGLCYDNRRKFRSQTTDTLVLRLPRENASLQILFTWCFVHFDFETCFAPQRRALFQQLNFQKCSEPVSS